MNGGVTMASQTSDVKITVFWWSYLKAEDLKLRENINWSTIK